MPPSVDPVMVKLLSTWGTKMPNEIDGTEIQQHGIGDSFFNHLRSPHQSCPICHDILHPPAPAPRTIKNDPLIVTDRSIQGAVQVNGRQGGFRVAIDLIVSTHISRY